MSPNMSIAVASPEDADILWDLTLQSRIYFKAKKIGGQLRTVATREMVRADIGSWYDLNRYFDALIARMNNEPVGCMNFVKSHSFYDGRILFMSRLFLVEKARGMGIGTKLMKKLASIAKEQNAIIEFMLVHDNPEIGFYQKLGAKIVARTRYEGIPHFMRYTMRIDRDAINKLVY